MDESDFAHHAESVEDYGDYRDRARRGRRRQRRRRRHSSTSENEREDAMACRNPEDGEAAATASVASWSNSSFSSSGTPASLIGDRRETKRGYEGSRRRGRSRKRNGRSSGEDGGHFRRCQMDYFLTETDEEDVDDEYIEGVRYRPASPRDRHQGHSSRRVPGDEGRSVEYEAFRDPVSDVSEVDDSDYEGLDGTEARLMPDTSRNGSQTWGEQGGVIAGQEEFRERPRYNQLLRERLKDFDMELFEYQFAPKGELLIPWVVLVV